MSIPNSWRLARLGEFCRYYKGGTPFKKLEYAPSGIPVLAKGDIKPFGRLEFSGTRFVTPSQAAEQGFYLSRPGDFLMTTRDLTQAGDVLGLVAPIPTDRQYLVNQGANVVRIDESRLDRRFFVYWTNGGIYRTHMKSRAVGSTQMHIQKSAFTEAPLWLPPMHEQRAIAHILGTLDDKIDLNRRMNETLEAMARALFKSWFIDFDPVRAKAEGRDPGLPNHLADLFPDSFEESESGEIPKGWTVTALSEVMEVNPPRALSKATVAPYLDMASMPTRGHSPDAVTERPFGSGMRFMNGDTLVARITPCLENGKTAYVDFLQPGQVGWGSTEYIVLRPKAPLPTQFAYCLARTDDFRAFAIQSMTGSSGRQRVPAESLAHYLLAQPSAAIAALFGHTVGPLFDRARDGTTESRILSTLRDTLLPKLVSGEIRVREAEKIVEATV